MKTNDSRFTNLLERVSPMLALSYERLTSVNLRNENARYIRSLKQMRVGSKGVLASIIAMFLFVPPAFYFVHWIAGLTVMAAGIIVAFRFFAMDVYGSNDWSAAKSILERFEEEVKNLDPHGHKEFIDREAVRKNLIAMSLEIADVECRLKYVREHGDTRALVDAIARLALKKQALERANEALLLFGLSFKKEELVFEKAA